MSYFDRLRREVKEISELPLKQFLHKLAHIEHRTLKQINMLIEDEEFPDRIKRDIQWVMCSINTVSPVACDSNIREVSYSKKYKTSKLLDTLEASFRDLEDKRIESRFGILNTNISGMLMRRWEWERANEVAEK